MSEAKAMKSIPWRQQRLSYFRRWVLALVGGLGVLNSGVTMVAQDWSVKMVDSMLQRQPDSVKNSPWGYAKALDLMGIYLVYKRTGDPRYLPYIQNWVDSHINSDGVVDRQLDTLDSWLPANLLVLLHQATGDEKYAKAARYVRSQLDTYPRNSDGALWHAKWRTNEIWLDGTYMSQPWLLRYGKEFHDEPAMQAEAVKQLVAYASHLQDAKTGLLYHAYDESGMKPWADPVTHHSPVFWSRSIGWYAMATVDTLESLPPTDPRRAELLRILGRLAKALEHYQDPKTGLWYNVTDQVSNPQNWLETSASSMFVYALFISAEHGYLPKRYKEVALKGYRGVLSRVSLNSDGLTEITGVCEGTVVDDLAYYLGRKQPLNDPHGFGAFLLMNEAVTTGKSSMQMDGRKKP